MLRSLALGLLLTSSLTPAHAQFSGDGFGVPGFFQQGFIPFVPPAFVGPFDTTVGAQPIWYSTRAASTAMAAAATQALISAVASNGGSPVTCDLIVATTGDLGVTGTGCASGAGVAAATFCAQGGGSCVIATWYNIGTNGSAQDMTATGTLRPPLVFGATNGRACAQMDKSIPQRLGSTWVSQAQPYNMSAVAYRNSTTHATINDFISNSTNQFGFTAAASTAFIYAGGTALSAAAVDNVFHSMQGTFNTTSSVLNIDGTDTTSGTSIGNAALSAAGGTSIIGGNSSAANDQTGFVCEAGAGGFGVAWTSAQRIALQANQKAWFGTP